MELAGLWASIHGELTARVAHEVNNALNGAIVNLEVVRARARPGGDAAALASFAADAATEVDTLASYAAALLALGRTARGETDAAAVARDAVTLLAPVARHARLRLTHDGDRACATEASGLATRAAIVGALLRTVEIAGALPASDPERPVRCTTSSGPVPAVEIAPPFEAAVPPDVRRLLAAAGIVVTVSEDAMRLALPPIPRA